MILMLSQPSLAGVGAGAELGNTIRLTGIQSKAWKDFGFDYKLEYGLFLEIFYLLFDRVYLP